MFTHDSIPGLLHVPQILCPQDILELVLKCQTGHFGTSVKCPDTMDPLSWWRNVLGTEVSISTINLLTLLNPTNPNHDSEMMKLPSFRWTSLEDALFANTLQCSLNFRCLVYVGFLTCIAGWVPDVVTSHYLISNSIWKTITDIM